MNLDGLKDRLLALARIRLKNRPYDLATLELEINSPTALMTHHSLHSRLMFVQYEPLNTVAYITGRADIWDGELIKLIDEWAEKRKQSVPDVKPLPPLQRAELPPSASRSSLGIKLPRGPGWTLNKPVRLQGYRAPLYALLKQAHDAGLQKPTARDVLDAWRKSCPHEVTEVLPDEIKYQAGTGTKTANVEAIKKAIARMTAKA